jgi:methylase of polypeptide subunit release factors
MALSAQEKLRRGLGREIGADDVNVGLLLPDDPGADTPAPFAIVCEFRRVPSAEVLEAAHRLAWNYSKAPLLLTVDPSSVRAWTCCEIPTQESTLFTGGPEITEVRLEWRDKGEQGQLATALHWVNLVSGRFFAEHAERFIPAGRLDQVLLSNLKSIRQQLHRARLPYTVAHDLLGRVIFIQFLFQRTDSSGNAALNAAVLHRLLEQGVLKKRHEDLASILFDRNDVYRFFRWLNEKFNGDLFPGKQEGEEEREQEWQHEITQVRAEHLQMLSEFVAGEILLDSGQRSLFPLYSFDTIPLEFISSIYEEFVSVEPEKSAGAHYTPAHVVDLILDGVLPWADSHWNLKVLDASCGSGIFLVKAFQRLIHRWRRAHQDNEPAAADLKQILENNIFGVDINADAVRVASFSLYLAMCDEIDPRYYWTQVRFPRLRERNLHAGDYFALDKERPDLSTREFDLIIGNAPWGKNTVTTHAKEWGTKNKWVASYGTLGPLFLPRAAQALTTNGVVSMLQPSSLLTNSVKTARIFRHRLFTDFKVDEVINLSALRFGLFANAVDPACVVTLRSVPPDGEFLSYICPKPSRSSLDDYRISIDPQDANLVDPREAATQDDLWSVLIWGGRRDLALIRKLSEFPNFAKLTDKSVVKTREGIIRGDRKKQLNTIVGRRILEGRNVDKLSPDLDPRDLPINKDNRVDSRASTDFGAFTIPQLIIKQGWSKGTGRFEAALVRSDTRTSGVICSQSYISVSSKDAETLEIGRAVYRSIVAVYYLLLTSGRFSSYRPEPTAADILSVPIPVSRKGERASRISMADVDGTIRRLFNFGESEWCLINDLFTYTLPDFKGDASSPGRLPTNRTTQVGSDQLALYCGSVMRVLQSAFGTDKKISCAVYEEPDEPLLPIRLVTVYLDSRESSGRIERKRMASGLLLAELDHISHRVVSQSDENAPLLRSRVMRMYTTLEIEGKQVPSVVIVKPDQCRFWIPSAGLRDADEIAADLLTWSAGLRLEVASSVH